MNIVDEVSRLESTDLPAWFTVEDAIKKRPSPAGTVGKSRMESLVFYHMSVKIRLECARSFLKRVLAARKQRSALMTARRDFEAWLFFARSALDCEAMFVNELCQVGLPGMARDTSHISERCQSATRPVAARDQLPGSSFQLRRSANDERCTPSFEASRTACGPGQVDARGYGRYDWAERETPLMKDTRTAAAAQSLQKGA